MITQQTFYREQGVLHTLTYKDRINILVEKGFSKDEAYAMTSEQLIEWTDPLEPSDDDGMFW